MNVNVRDRYAHRYPLGVAIQGDGPTGQRPTGQLFGLVRCSGLGIETHASTKQSYEKVSPWPRVKVPRSCCSRS